MVLGLLGSLRWLGFEFLFALIERAWDGVGGARRELFVEASGWRCGSGCCFFFLVGVFRQGRLGNGELLVVRGEFKEFEMEKLM
jgi:hypothetical protein